MNWLTNFSTRAKLFVGFGVMLAFLLIVTATAFTGMSVLQDAQQTIVRDDALSLDLMTFRNNINRQRASLLTMMADPRRRAKLEQDLTEQSQENEEIMQRLLSQQRYAKFRDRMRALDKLRNEFQQTRDVEVVPLIRSGKIAQAQALSLGIQSNRYESMRELSTGLTTEAEDSAKNALDTAADRARRALQTFLVVCLVAVLAGIWMAMLLNRLIAAPLREIAAAAENIALGDLGAANDLSLENRRDEVGVLAQAFNRMTRSLRDMAGVAGQIAAGDRRAQPRPQSGKDVLGNAFAAMIENLRRVLADLSEAASVLGTSSSEIVASTSQFAANATETSVAVTETTATVAEVRQTAQVSSDKARSVSNSAQKAAEISLEGRQATEATGADIERIQEQMESIAESMVRLSEQSRDIGAIIATVDDLAQQSNLLAVNAAIEAAKAGEQGKGFAVVAQEVKNLAEQSRQATNQVRTILKDIQKATSAAVMATEQGSKAVETGVRQSARAGEAIGALSDSVDEAAQAATQIAASSQEQLVGMDQVVMAMESIKQASGQNVDGARQLETAAHDVNELGQRLKQLVERYQV
ncbi:MAG TPA: methyl-accepting chemotaxis protein [Abditibacteriaceae bacterium]|nr:methyl-accepting chemotaxis protein [Abditibacteriaceae bacterium]